MYQKFCNLMLVERISLYFSSYLSCTFRFDIFLIMPSGSGLRVNVVDYIVINDYASIKSFFLYKYKVLNSVELESKNDVNGKNS